MLTGSDLVEAGAVGACTQCLISLGVDPLWAPPASFAAVLLGTMAVRAFTWWRDTRAAAKSRGDGS